MTKEERIEELKEKISGFNIELHTLMGRYGVCERCGEHGEFYSWGKPICVACVELEKKQKKYEFLKSVTPQIKCILDKIRENGFFTTNLQPCFSCEHHERCIDLHKLLLRIITVDIE